MRFFVIGIALAFSVINGSCYAAGAAPNMTVTDNIIKGEYIVVINNTEISPSVAQKELRIAMGECEVTMISKSAAHIVFDIKNDPGLEEIKKKLSKFKWVKTVEQNKEVHIS